MSHLRDATLRLAKRYPNLASDLESIVKSAAWDPPKLNKSLARLVAKNVSKTWASDVSSLDDIGMAITRAVMGEMSMRDRVDNHDAVKKWRQAMPDDALRQMFRWIEEIKNGNAAVQWRKTDEALKALR